MQKQPVLVDTTPASALFLTVASGLAFGASSALVPLIKLNAIILGVALVLAFLVHMRLRCGLAAGLAVSLLSGALATVAMWALWFGLAHGFGSLWSIVQQGPKGIAGTIRNLAATTSVNVRISGTTTTHTPDQVSLVWLIETVAMLAAPVLGALSAPFARRSSVTA